MGFDSFWVEAPQSQKDLLKPRTLLVEKGYEPKTMEVQKGNLTWNTGRCFEQSFLTFSEQHAGIYEDDDKDGEQQVQAQGEPTGRGQEQVPGL